MPDSRELADRAAALLLTRPPNLGATRLGVVDGPSGSGKSTFAELWVRALERTSRGAVALFSADLLATWDDPFGWWNRFDIEVLRRLSAGEPGRIRVTDWSSGAPALGDSQDVPVTDVLILEGVSCGRAAVAGRAGVTVWLEPIGRRERLERAVGRDGESSRAQLAAWQDAEDAFFASDHPAERADLVLTAGGLSGPMPPAGPRR